MLTKVRKKIHDVDQVKCIKDEPTIVFVYSHFLLSVISARIILLNSLSLLEYCV